VARGWHRRQIGKLGGAGFEPATPVQNPRENRVISEPAAQIPAHSDAKTAQNGPQPASEATPLDADLQALIAAWPTLPDAIKAGILAMVKASGKGGGQ